MHVGGIKLRATKVRRIGRPAKYASFRIVMQPTCIARHRSLPAGYMCISQRIEA